MLLFNTVSQMSVDFLMGCFVSFRKELMQPAKNRSDTHFNVTTFFLFQVPVVV